MSYYNQYAEANIIVDASPYGLGAILTQKQKKVVNLSFRNGSAIVAKFGIYFAQKFTKPKKLRTRRA
jgi:hypothetical protein